MCQFSDKIGLTVSVDKTEQMDRKIEERTYTRMGRGQYRDIQTGRQADRQTNRKYRHMNGEPYEWTDRQTDGRRTDRQM